MRRQYRLAILFAAFFMLLLSATAFAAGTKVKVKSITLEQDTYFFLPGMSLELKATLLPDNATNKKLKWTCSNTKIAKISQNGTVKALKKGKTYVTAKATDGSGVKFRCTIKVLRGGSYATTKDTSVGAEKVSSKRTKFINCLKKYSAQVEKDAAAGKPWIYSNSRNTKTYSGAVGANRRVNCAIIARWALKECGILSYNHSFWGSAYGTILYSVSGTEKALKKGCYIIKANDTAGNLAKSGKMQVGDICIYDIGQHGHTNIFMGYDAGTGECSWFDAGRNGIDCYLKNGQWYFKTLKMKCSKLNDYKISYLIRVK